MAIAAALLVPTYAFESPNAGELRAHPVSLVATVTESYIDGFGGDPTVAYRFTVSGRTYSGTGTGGELGNGDVLHLKTGDRINIQYAATDPATSCTCNAASADPWRMPKSAHLNLPSLGLLVPLLGMTAYTLRRRYEKRWAVAAI